MFHQPLELKHIQFSRDLYYNDDAAHEGVNTG